jgi:hypothetical protein
LEDEKPREGHSGAAQAALIDRGGGLIYDDVLNVTWLQDANYAKTSGYVADGLMNWIDATTWADNLVYHDSVRNVTYTDWRLPTASPVNGTTWDLDTEPYDGTADSGWNITSPASELAYMYYVNLGLQGSFSPSGDPQPDYGIFGNGDESVGAQNDVGLVKNLQTGAYWFGIGPSVVNVYGESLEFAFGNGSQCCSPSDEPLYAWAVRPGDVAAVPEADTWAMLLAGLGLVGAAARRRG